MQPNDLNPLTETDIAEYLINNPGFFQRNQELLTSLQLGSAHGQRVVSLHERQAEMLREKIKVLENRLVDLIRHGSENGITTSRLLDWATSLHLVHDPTALPNTICNDLKERFIVPQVAIRVWGVSEAYAHEPFAQGVNDDIKSFASSLTSPYCGMHVGVEAVSWLEEPLLAASLALLPLRDVDSNSPAFGLLVLASPDANRYQDDMATDYLEHISSMASAALSRLIVAEPHTLAPDTILEDELDIGLDTQMGQSTL